MSSAADIIREIGRGGEDSSRVNDNEPMDVIEFVESRAGLQFSKEISGRSLFPVQKFILKAFYGLPLEDEEKTIRIPKTWRYAQAQDEERYYNFTEKEYMEYLYENGRCNIKEPDGERHELILPIGRRSGKSFISGIIAAYETYKLLKKGNPQEYYGLPEGDQIQICSVATATDQAQILYKEAKRHFNNCDFYDQYLSKNTQKYVQFQTPRDIQETGKAKDGGDQSVKVTFYPSRSSGIRGSANIVVIMDEVAFFSRKGESSAEAVYDAVEPSVATFSPKVEDVNGPIPDSEGRIIMISSPYSKDGLFYKKYQASKSNGPGADDILMIQAPTWEVNPTVSVETFKKSYDKNPRSFNTEFGAKFSDKVQTWIEREEDLDVCIKDDLKPQKKGKTREPHYMGLDLGVKNDRTALALTRPEGEGVRLVYHELWQSGVPWRELNPHLEEPLVDYARHLEDEEVLDFDEIANWVNELSRKFYVKKGMFDQFEGISFEQTINKMGLSQIEMKNFSSRQTSDQFQAFKNLMFHEKLELYDYVIERQNEDYAPYINELLELQATKGRGKREKIEAPDVAGKYDDFADALMRSIWLSYQKVRDGAKSAGGHQASGGSGSGKPGSRSRGDLSKQYRKYRRKKRRGGIRTPNSKTGRG